MKQLTIPRILFLVLFHYETLNGAGSLLPPSDPEVKEYGCPEQMVISKAGDVQEEELLVAASF